MSILSGAFLHDINGFVIDRIQTGGAGNINQPIERIYELGNWQTVATVRDVPDLSFDLETFDMTCELEAILTGNDPTASIDGDEFFFDDAFPLDVISPFKSDINAYNIVTGIAIPYLNLERVTYRFGVRQNATQQFSFRGDSIYYVPGTPYYQEFTNTGTGTYNFTNTAIEYVESGDSIYALCVTLRNTTTGVYRRLFIGDDFTNTATGFTLLEATQATYNQICVVYGSAVAATYLQTVHETATVKPAAIRGKDIDVYVGTTDATPVFTRWTGIQSFEVSRSVNLEADEEMGNPHYVTQDYSNADVTGSIVLKPRDPTELWERIAEIANIATNKVVGPYTTALLPIEVRITDPESGDVLKTIYVPDARFTVPGIQGRVQTKQEVTLPFQSDTGVLKVYKGLR